MHDLVLQRKSMQYLLFSMFHVKLAKIDNLSKICVALTILAKETFRKLTSISHLPSQIYAKIPLRT